MPRPARLPIERTQRCAVRRSRRWPSRRRRIGPSWRSPMARSIVRAVRGTSGIVGGLVALANDLQGAVAAVEAEVFDVGGARFGDSQAVEAEQDSERGVGAVVAFGGEQEGAELAAVHAVALVRLDLGAADVLGRVRGDAPVDVSEPVEAADRREAPVDRRGGKRPLFHRAAVQLDVGPGGGEHGEVVAERPLEVHAQVVPVRLEGAAAVARQERHDRQLSFIDRNIWTRKPDRSLRCLQSHCCPPSPWENSEHPDPQPAVWGSCLLASGCCRVAGRTTSGNGTPSPSARRARPS